MYILRVVHTSTGKHYLCARVCTLTVPNTSTAEHSQCFLQFQKCVHTHTSAAVLHILARNRDVEVVRPDAYLHFAKLIII